MIVGTGTSKSRFIKTKWPITSGLTAGTTKTQDREIFLTPKEGSLVEKRLKKLL